MKKISILFMGSVMVLATPALADSSHRSNQNDNSRSPPASTSQQQGGVSYADYVSNDDDHGDEADENPESDDDKSDKPRAGR